MLNLHYKALKATIFVVVVVSFIVMHIWAYEATSIFFTNVTEGLSAFSSDPVAIVLFLVLYLACCQLLVPTLPFNLLAGVIWGGVLGGILSALVVTLSAVLGFWLVKCSPWKIEQLHRMIKPAAQYIDREITKNDWRLIAFLRLNPIFPSSPLNYAFGFTSVNFWRYVWISLMSLLPPSIAMAFVGEMTGEIAQSGLSTESRLYVFYGLLALSLVCLFPYLARKFLRVKGAIE